MRSETGPATDEAVIERLLAGDEAAFCTLVTAHHASLLRLALTFVSDHGAAEEVVQDTWLGVLKGLKNLRATRVSQDMDLSDPGQPCEDAGRARRTHAEFFRPAGPGR